ncbi:MAG: aminotransferase class V-fold PLP-dependent enzyme [Gammaproteobacteria bacterium]|nr:MAG: aminotransferase class V-fold PLP-dependent enzyme [Gammaproteobacteria bacterium]
MLGNQKSLFSLPEDLHFLNCASRAPLLNEAQALGVAGLRWQIAPLTAGPDEYARESEELRRAVADLINGSPDQIAITPSVSYGVAIAAHNLRLRRGQNVVSVEEEFPSDVYAWMERCRKDGAELRRVARPEDTAKVSSLWNERLLDAIDAQTAVVTVSSVHWTDGVRYDLEAIGHRAREVGALFVVDGTQSIGAADFDLARIQPDLLVCAGYKWLLGPYQIGFAAIGERLMGADPFEYHWSNRAGSHDTTATAYRREYERGARRFDVGEHANHITVPMLTEGVRQAIAWGSRAIQDYCTALTGPLVKLLEDERFSVAPASQRIAHIIGIRLADASRIPAVMAALGERRVCVSQRGQSIRISPHVYNTPEDIEALMDGLVAAASGP